MFPWGNIMRMFWVLAVMLSALSSPAVAEKKPVPLYPPYPDVWGQEVPPEAERPWIIGNPQADGDVGLLYGTTADAPGDRLRGFFSGREEEVLWDGFENQEKIEWNKRDVMNEGYPFSVLSIGENQTIFRDGKRNFYIKRSRFNYSMNDFKEGVYGRTAAKYGNWACILGDFVHIMYENQQPVGAKVIVRRRPQVVDTWIGGPVYWEWVGKQLDYDNCGGELPYDGYSTRIAMWRLSSHPRLVLKDGTFLAVVHSSLRGDDGGADGWDERVVVRMRPDFTSPYLDQRDDVYIVDFARILPILKESELRAMADPSFNDGEFIFAQIDALIDTLPPKPASAKH